MKTIVVVCVGAAVGDLDILTVVLAGLELDDELAERNLGRRGAERDSEREQEREDFLHRQTT